MIDVRKIEVQSIGELILALHPVQAAGHQFQSLRGRDLRVAPDEEQHHGRAFLHLLFPREDTANDPEFRHVVDEVRRECLLINGMISRIMFRQRWLFSVSKIEDACDVLAHYQDMAGAACRMCFFLAPELGNNLLNAF